MKAKRSDFTVKLFVRFLFSPYKFSIRKNYSKFVCLLGKIINIIQSFSFQLYDEINIICSKSAKGRSIDKSIFSDETSQSFSFG